ncbi:MAG: SHOCT domain-containing protein [Acidimicrobiia bacterium]
MMWYDWNAMGIFGWTMMILFWVAVFLLVVWAIRSIGGSKYPSLSDALQTLQRRYAAGEIDGDEYEERRRMLEDSKTQIRR